MDVFLPQIGKSASSWSIDTRTLQAGDVFFALNDGYRFANSALEKGALAAIVSIEPPRIWISSSVPTIRSHSRTIS